MAVLETRADGVRVVVTGSQGFVGRHVRAAIERRGGTCIGVDLPGTGAEIEIDLADPDFEPDRVWDAAGSVASVVYMAANISRTTSVDAVARSNLRVISEAPVRLIEAGVLRGACAHIVDCSTLKVFGPQRQPLIDPATHPRRPDPFSYGSAKALAERFLAVAAPRAGFTFAVVHSMFIYGPGQRPQNAIPLFLSAALRGERPVVLGDGASIRDDVYAPDLADILVEAALRRTTGFFHGAGERPRSILEVARLCCEAVAKVTGGAALTPRLDPGTPAKWWIDQTFDLGPTRSTFGYEPTPLIEGLAGEVEWLRDGAPPETEGYVRR